MNTCYSIIFFVVLVGLSPSIKAKELMEVYECQAVFLKITLEDEKIITERFFRQGNKLSEIEWKDPNFLSIYLKAIIRDRSGDPFFGKSNRVILKVGDIFYVLTIESGDYNKSIGRIGLGKLIPLDFSPNTYFTSPLEGVFFDVKLVSRISKIISSQKEKQGQVIEKRK